MGVSAEDQQRRDIRVPELLETSAVVRFVAAEPLPGRPTWAAQAGELPLEVVDVVVTGRPGRRCQRRARPRLAAW
jgi:hypothetical protein